MAGQDRTIYGFNEQDKDSILDNLQRVGGQSSRSNRPSPGFRWKYGMTKPEGLPANGTGRVFVQVPTLTDWENSYEVDCWNRGPAVDGNMLLLLIEIDSRICVHEVCLDG